MTWTVVPVPEYTTYGGAGIAGTIDGQVRYTHVVVSNLEEAWAGGNDASVYLRTGDDGESWGQRLLLGGIDPAVAAAGAHVYVALEAYACRSGIGILTNADHGRRKRWSDTHCLTTDRELDSEWAPVIAASGDLVQVAAVDSRTTRAGVWTSPDDGSTWSHTVLGSARPDTDLCCVGPIQVIAADALAAVAWSDQGEVVARVSGDGGRTWGDTAKLATGTVIAGAGADGRLAFSGTGADGTAWIQEWTAEGGWASVSMPSQSPSGEAPNAAAVARNLAQSGPLTWFACWFESGSEEVQLSTGSGDAPDWTSPGPAPACGSQSLARPDGPILQITSAPDDQDYAYALAIGTMGP